MAGHGRVYRTLDGSHVPEGHPDAAFLAFSQFDDLPKEVAAELADKGKKKAPVADKQTKPADK